LHNKSTNNKELFSAIKLNVKKVEGGVLAKFTT